MTTQTWTQLRRKDFTSGSDGYTGMMAVVGMSAAKLSEFHRCLVRHHVRVHSSFVLATNGTVGRTTAEYGIKVPNWCLASFIQECPVELSLPTKIAPPTVTTPQRHRSLEFQPSELRTVIDMTFHRFGHAFLYGCGRKTMHRWVLETEAGKRLYAVKPFSPNRLRRELEAMVSEGLMIRSKNAAHCAIFQPTRQ